MVALANGLSSRVQRMDLVVANVTGEFVGEVSPRVRLIDLGGKRTSAALPDLVRYLRWERPDILMSTLSHANLVAVFAKRLARVSTAVVVREASTPDVEALVWSRPKAASARLLMNSAYRLADGVVAVSAGVAEAISKLARIPQSDIATLYNPVVTEDLAELANRPVAHHFFAPKTAPVVLNVGGLRSVKGHDTLLRAFRLVVDDVDARLLLLGEGPERARLESLVTELGLGDCVDMPGFDPNPFAYMSRSDLYVLSSQREGLPGALIQALACGLPAVATDCRSGPAEVLEGGRLGELVPVGDVAAMAAAIKRALAAPRDPAPLIAQGAKYRAEPVIDAFLDYFGRLAARTHVPGRPRLAERE